MTFIVAIIARGVVVVGVPGAGSVRSGLGSDGVQERGPYREKSGGIG